MGGEKRVRSPSGGFLLRSEKGRERPDVDKESGNVGARVERGRETPSKWPYATLHNYEHLWRSYQRQPSSELEK